MGLTESKIKGFKPKEKRYKKLDSSGLYIFIEPSGSKIFRLRYKKQNGKDSTVKIGVYPLLSLVEARKKAFEIKQRVCDGLGVKEPIKEEIVTFDFLMLEFLEKKKERVAFNTYRDYLSLYNNHIKPYIGLLDINEIDESHIADIIKSMTLRGIKTAQSDARSLMEWAFDFAYTKYKYNRRNPAQINISIFLPNHKTTPFRHLVKKDDIREMMIKIKNYTSSYSNIKVALELMPYVFLRPYNLASAKWEDIDFNKKLWVIPAKEMKMRRDHSVPLTDKMIELIKSVEYNRKISPYLFRSHISSRGHIAPDSLTVVLRKLEINSTAHGMRHMASTLLRENAKIEGFSKEAIEYQLAHVEGGISGVYNHADYLGERFKIMQWWSDWLESLY